MLRSMRDGAKEGFLKYILLGFMALAVGGLVLTDVGGFFRGGLGSTTVAKGRGIDIGLQDFDRTVRRAVAAQGISVEEAYRMGLVDRLLQSEIQRRLIIKAARDNGYQAGDDVVLKEIEGLSANLPTAEGQTKRDALVQFLRAQGLSEAAFIETVRDDVGIRLFAALIAAGQNGLSGAQAAPLLAYQNETRTFEGVSIDPEQIEITETPDEGQLRALYEARTADYRQAERRDIILGFLSEETVGKSITISEEDIKFYYEDNIDRFTKAARRTILQAVFEEQAQAQEALNAIRNRGLTLENAAKEIAPDTNAYLGEQTFTKAALPDALAEPIFTADVDTLIGPIKTDFGWQIVSVEGAQEAETQTFDFVKNDIRDILKNERLADDFVDLANMLDDRLAAGDSFDTVAADMNLQNETIEGIAQTGFNQNNKDSLADYTGTRAAILENAFDLAQGETSPVFELDDGRFAVLKVADVQEATVRPYEEVQSDLNSLWQETQQRFKAAELTETVKALYAQQKNDALKKLISENGAVQEADFKNLKRNATTQDLEENALQSLFTAAKGDLLTLRSHETSYIGRVRAIALPESYNDNDIQTLQTAYENVLPEEVLSGLILSMSDKRNVRINDALLARVYGNIDS